MSQETLLYIMAAAVVVSAAAVVIQLILLFGMFFAFREAKQKFLQLSEKAEPLLDTSKSLLEQSRTQVIEITTRTNAILNSAQTQMARIEEFLTDATNRGKSQMEHVELVMDDTLNRFQETSTMLQKGILRPLRQLNGLAAGMQAAIEYLIKGHRTTVERATQEDEMFI
jgi:hypothetical protein